MTEDTRELLRTELTEAFRHRTRRDLRWVMQYITSELARSDISRYPAAHSFLRMTYDLAVAELDSRAEQDRARCRCRRDDRQPATQRT